MRALAALLLLGAAGAHAADLPCGGPAVVTLKMRWHPPAQTPATPITGYRLYRCATINQQNCEPPIPIATFTIGADGIAVAPVDGWPTTRDSFTTITALGPGGESVHSNEIMIAATSFGPCRAPGAPELLEPLRQLDSGLDDVTRGTAKIAAARDLLRALQLQP